MNEIIREVSGALMALSFMTSLVPQILKIIKTKSSDDLSPLMIALCFSGYFFGMIYMYFNVFGFWWFMNYTTGMVTSIALFVVWLKNIRK